MSSAGQSRRTSQFYQHGRVGRQDPYSRSRVPRLPFRLRDRLIPANPATKRPWRYAEVGRDAVLYSRLGRTTEDHIAHWKQVLPPSQWLIRTGRVEGVDDDLALVVWDVDRPEHAPAMPVDAWQVKTKRGIHWYTWTPSDIAGSTTAWGELKARGGLVMAPGSRHPEGGVYRPLAGFGELVDGQLPLLPPEYLPTRTPEKARAPVEAFPEGIDTTGRLPAPVRAEKGERWLTMRGLLVRCAGSRARRGDVGQLRALAHWYNSRFVPPMETGRVERLARDVAEASRTWGTTDEFLRRQAQRGVLSGHVRGEPLRERNMAILAAREAGVTIPQVAELHGVSVSTVKRIISEAWRWQEA